ncbi:5'-nucleotidase domain-containing protein 4, partial [Dorcoceras hygrometricum]
ANSPSLHQRERCNAVVLSWILSSVKEIYSVLVYSTDASSVWADLRMVDRLDEGAIGADIGPLDYKGLYKAVEKALFRAHVEGQLKNEIMSKPELFVEPDPELPLALLDQKEAGKRLLLTNSDYHYTDKMMQHSFNIFLPNDINGRDLFDMSGDHVVRTKKTRNSESGASYTSSNQDVSIDLDVDDEDTHPIGQKAAKRKGKSKVKSDIQGMTVNFNTMCEQFNEYKLEEDRI